MTEDFADLARAMAALARRLDELPEGVKLTAAEVADLEDVRHAALKLAHVAEVVLEESNQ